MKKNRMSTMGSAAAIAIAVVACAGKGNDATLTVQAAGIIDQFEIISSIPAFNGATPPGASGPYQVITGIVHGKLNPAHADNAGIVDLSNAPVGTDGYVNYTTDVVILRPQSAGNARRILFYDVVNRGNKLGQANFVGGGLLGTGAAPVATLPSVLQYGYTVVWSGWQGSIAQSGNGVSALLGTRFPIASEKNGSLITGLSREEFIPDYAGASTVMPLTYAPASTLDQSEVTFTARQSWRNANGKQDYAAPSVPVVAWNYVLNANGTFSVSFTPPASVPLPDGSMTPPDAGTIYSFVYRAQNPMVNGIGFAAVRDLIAFLRNVPSDAKGNPNPLNDLKTAACAAGGVCPVNPGSNFDVAIGEGISQSGRFLRDFLYQGFNKDAAGNKVFDGLMPIVPAGRRTWVNARFSQGGRWSKQHEDHWMPGDQFPFAYNVISDPVSGATDGLLKQCSNNNTCPKVMQLDGSFEWWGGRASLVVTDGAGKDLTLPDNVRYYLVAGTQHTGGPGVSSGILPAPSSLCQFPTSPVTESPVERALIPAMEKWLTLGTLPPASQYPTVASNNLVATTQAALGFPDLSNVMVPTGANATPTALSLVYSGLYNQLFMTDYGNAVPVANLSKPYAVLVPKVDANGNETSGILVPDLKVPLASYMGWNQRAIGHAVGESCTTNGSAIAFAVSASAKSGGNDTRASLADLYSGRADYQNKVTIAANALVAQGYLLQADATNLFTNNAAKISSNLIPNP